MIRIKRVYEAAEAADGARFLVDRLWPRGVSKEKLQLTAWLKEAAPSNELRKWYHHDLEQWSDFKRRYEKELEAAPEAWAPLVEAARKEKSVTLLYSSHETERNNAAVLKEFLERRLGKKKT